MGRGSVYFVGLRIAGICLGVFVAILIAGPAAWAQADGVWSGRGEATGRGTESELRARAIDNGQQRALANWLKVRLDPALFAEYSKVLQRTLMVRASEFVVSQTVTDLERPSAQTLRLTVLVKFDESALESSLRAGGYLRPWSGRKDVLTYALSRNGNGYALASTTGANVDGLLQRLAYQEMGARWAPRATIERVQASGPQASVEYFVQALTHDSQVALHLIWLLGEHDTNSIEAYSLASTQATQPSIWTAWQASQNGASPQSILHETLGLRLNALDQPWENWVLLRADMDGPALFALASKLADVPMFDEVSPVQLTRQGSRSELSLHFYSLANTREIEIQIRERMKSSSMLWSTSAAGRPVVTVDLASP